MWNKQDPTEDNDGKNFEALGRFFLLKFVIAFNSLSVTTMRCPDV